VFSKISGLSSLILVACTAAVFWFHGRLRPEDALKYQKLVQESRDLHSKQSLEQHPAHQTREDVQKDIWTLRNGKRAHFQLKSQGSELTIRQSKDKFEAIEQLQHLESFLQNDDIRYLLAKEGTYFYPSHRFLAKETTFSSYRQASELPFLQGTAREAVFEATDETPTITAHGVQGIFDAMHCEADEMNWLNENLSLSGNVRLLSAKIQGKETFALADKLIYNPRDKTLLLSSEKRVLFWQEGSCLSASAIRIHRDPVTQLDSIEGVGDVHFAFDLEEENAIQQLLGKYL